MFINNCGGTQSLQLMPHSSELIQIDELPTDSDFQLLSRNDGMGWHTGADEDVSCILAPRVERLDVNSTVEIHVQSESGSVCDTKS